MIGIFQNSYLSITKTNELLRVHWENVEATIKSVRFRKDEYAETISGAKLIEEIDNLIAPLSLRAIVQWNYETIVNIIENKEATFVEANDKIKQLYGYSIQKKGKKYNKAKELLFDRIYKKFRIEYGESFVEELKITVCPYCNRNYINSGRDVTMAQLDHFFPKSEYPLLALSFYNLVPCCYSCNHTKSDKIIKNVKMISPYDKSRKTDSIIKFSYLPKKDGKYQIEVQGYGMAKKEMEKNIEVFHLDKQYSIHTDIVDVLRIKVEHEPPEYLEAIRKLLKREGDSTFLSEEEVYYGTYLTQDRYFLRPLSKFEHDIINQIKSGR